MSDPIRSAYSGPTLSGPGVIVSASHITKPDLLTDEAFNKWYNEVHIPDVLATGGVPIATRFRNANPAAPAPYLAIYTVPDLSIIHSQKFKNIPMTHKSLPEGGNIHNYANFDTRFYQLIQEHAEDEQSDEYSTALLLAGVEPASGGEEDYDAYMRDEHLAQMALEPGWRRSKRYKLVFQVNAADAASWLALYEFDEKNKLGIEVKPLEPMTDWTKRTFAKSTKMELGIFHKLGSFSK